MTAPFKSNKIFRLEQMNEFFVVLLQYHMMCFASFVVDYTTKNYIGWSMIGTMVLNIGINFGIIIFDTIKEAYYKLRLKYW